MLLIIFSHTSDLKTYIHHIIYDYMFYIYQFYYYNYDINNFIFHIIFMNNYILIFYMIYPSYLYIIHLINYFYIFV
jgi:hypothetical protein